MPHAPSELEAGAVQAGDGEEGILERFQVLLAIFVSAEQLRPEGKNLFS